MAIEVKADGPLFDGSAPQRTRQVIRTGVEKIALDAQGHIQRSLYPGHGKVSGRFQRAIVGRATGDLIGIVAPDDGSGAEVIYSSWLEEGPHGKQHPGRFHGYGFFAEGMEYVQNLDVDSIVGVLIVETLS